MKGLGDEGTEGERDKAQVSKIRSLLKCIDKDMVLMKVGYLLWSGLATVDIYFNPFIVSIGIPKSKAGIVYGISCVVFVIAAPLWGILADHTGRQSLILILLCLVSSIWIPSLPLIASAVGEKVEANSTVYPNSTGKKTVQDMDAEISNGNTMFYTFVVVTAIGSVFFSCLDGYIEAITLKTIKVSPSGATYGTQRVYGSIGASILIYLTGVLLDHIIIKDMSPYAIIYFMYPIFPLLLIPVMLLVIRQQRKWMDTSKCTADGIPPLDTPDTLDENNESICKSNNILPLPSPGTMNEDQESIWKELVKLFCQMDSIVFILTALISGFASSVVYFMVFFINENMDVSNSKVSLAFSVDDISNIVAFFGASRLIKLLRGPVPTIIFGLLCCCIRYVLLSYTKSYWVVLALQGLSGFSYASIWCGFMEHVDDISSKEIKTTMILLVECVYYGLGTLLGNIVGGVIYSMFDATRFVRWTGMMCGIWSFILIVYYSFKFYREQHDIPRETGDTVIENDGTVGVSRNNNMSS